MEKTKVFRPCKSNGWIWPLGLGFVLLGLGVVAYFYGGASVSEKSLGTLILCVVLSIPGFLAAIWFPTMRYELEERTLHVRYGPWLHYVIPAASIRNLDHKVLPSGFFSGFRFPGLALFNNRYQNIGPVMMCSTAKKGAVLLIETDTAVYGLSPEDEKGFVSALKAAKRG